jgi:hypothetical protein
MQTGCVKTQRTHYPVKSTPNRERRKSMANWNRKSRRYCLPSCFIASYITKSSGGDRIPTISSILPLTSRTLLSNLSATMSRTPTKLDHQSDLTPGFAALKRIVSTRTTRTTTSRNTWAPVDRGGSETDRRFEGFVENLSTTLFVSHHTTTLIKKFLFDVSLRFLPRTPAHVPLKVSRRRLFT